MDKQQALEISQKISDQILGLACEAARAGKMGLFIVMCESTFESNKFDALRAALLMKGICTPAELERWINSVPDMNRMDYSFAKLEGIREMSALVNRLPKEHGTTAQELQHFAPKCNCPNCSDKDSPDLVEDAELDLEVLDPDMLN